VEKAMATGDAENRATIEERKWVRVMQIGMALLLAVPYGFWLGYALKNPILVLIIPLFLAIGGYLCLQMGHEKRVELRDQEKEDNRP
jgi:hypothetical protein